MPDASIPAMIAADVAYHAGMAATALAYFFRDMLILRALALASCGLCIAYGFLSDPGPRWPTIEWNALFAAVNIWNLGRLMHERRRVDLTEEEQELRETVFPTLTPVEFLKLLRVGRVAQLPAGEVLAREGEPLARLTLIGHGAARVEKDGTSVAEVRDGQFVGELVFLGEGSASATVTLTTPSRVLLWEHEALRRLLDRNPGMRLSVQASLMREVTRRLRRANTVMGRLGDDTLSALVQDVRQARKDRPQG